MDAHQKALRAAAREHGVPEGLLGEIIQAARDASRRGTKTVGAATLNEFVAQLADGTSDENS